MRARTATVLGVLALAGIASGERVREHLVPRAWEHEWERERSERSEREGLYEREGRYERDDELEGRREGESQEEFELEFTGAAGMMEQRAAQRSSAGPVSVGALLQAKEEIEQRAGGGTRDGGLWGWEWLGPGNVGGRILTILTRSGDQNRLWVGAASGGIWTTTNGGTTWSPVNDFLPSLTVTSLVSDPASAGVMYAATGEGTFSSGNKNAERSPGAGIFRSPDFGVTWSQLGTTASWSYVNRLAHHPTLSGILWAATDQPAGVWKSSDSGTSWTQTLSPNSAPTQVIVHSTTPTRVFVGTMPNGAGTNGHVYRSTDGGANFTDLSVGGANNLPTSTGRCEIGLGSNTTVYVLMDRNGGELYRSASNGDLGTWTQQVTTPALLGGQGFYDNVIWVDPTNSDRIVIGGVDIYRSTNHGNTWQWISNGSGWVNNTSAHPDQHAIVQRTGWDGVNNNTVYFGNDGGLYKTSNVFAADTLSGWTNLNNGLGVTQFYSVASSSTGSLITGGTQDNGLPFRNGSGTTWNRTPLYLDGASSAIDPNNSNIVYGLTQYGHVWKSTNGGASYSDATSGYLYGQGTALFNAPFELDPNNSTICWTGGVQIWRSTNSAGGWSAKRNTISGTPSVSAISVKPGNSNEVWIGYTDGTVSRTTNGGTNWTNVDAGSPALPDRWVMDIEASPFFANEAVVVLAGYSTQQIWATFDGGATWSDRSGGGSDVLPAIQMNCVSYHPVNSDWLYAGSDLGIFASNDFGLHWNVTPAWGNNDGPAYVEVDDLIFYQDRLLVGTWGRGIYRARPLSVVYVDLANVGTEDGTLTHPYNTVTEGINAMGNGTTLSIKTATYTEGAKTFNRAGLVVATGGTVTVR